MSYQAGILKPWFRVTGMIGAVGQITFMLAGLIVFRAPAQPTPVSPRPWRKMRVAVWRWVALIMTGGTEAILKLNKTEIV